MKVICILSHEVPLGDGRFDSYEKDQICDKEEYSEAYFKPVEEGKAAAGSMGETGLETSNTRGKRGVKK